MKKAAATRLHILQKAFELIYNQGYQTTSLDDILATTAVTKGAFYYHFKSKDEMGIAIIEEMLKPVVTSGYIAPLEKEANPLDLIYEMMQHLLLKDKFLKMELGCPAANFVQEMAPWHKEFSKVLSELTATWEKTIAESLEKGKKNGYIQKDVNSKQATIFILSGYWGIRNLGKLEKDAAIYKAYLKQLRHYLNSLAVAG